MKTDGIVWVAMWGALATAWCVAAAASIGATYDEPLYLDMGANLWRGDASKNVEMGTMPLPALVAGLPVKAASLMGVDLSFGDQLFASRAASVFFLWALLFGGYSAGTLWGGRDAGRIAVVMLALEPILLGHACLATTDVALSACLVGLTAAYRVRREQAGLRRFLTPSLWFAASILAKASALVMAPLVLAALEIEYRWTTPVPRFGALVRAPWHPLTIALLGLGVACVAFPGTIATLAFQIQHNAAGHGGTYLFGRVSPDGFWYYFLACFAIKVALPTFVFLAGLAFFQWRRLWNGPLFAAALILAASPAFRVQIGVRFLLPAIALTLVGVAIALGRWLPSLSPRSRKIAWCVVAFGLAWNGWNALRVWPHGLTFANEAWGGPSRGHRHLSDSNHDWGQGMLDLQDWAAKHPETPIDVCYFGTDPRASLFPRREYLELHQKGWDELARYLQGRRLAISITMLYGIFECPCTAELRRRTPFARTTTFAIFDFSTPNGRP